VALAPGLAVAAGLVVPAGVLVAPESLGSPVAAGLLVAPPPPDSPPPSHAPRNVARLKTRAKPKIFVFITPLSPIVAITNFRLMNKIPYLLLFFNIL
jgi:hypothetical protein